VAWYSDNSGDRKHTVGTKSANELGLYDMSGNVSEWVADVYGGDYLGYHPDFGWIPGRRVIRGGSYHDSARNARVSIRSYEEPGNRHSNLGFRLACSSK
jgi:formylglycine-generating enzyme required for sulfatase activity